MEAVLTIRHSYSILCGLPEDMKKQTKILLWAGLLLIASLGFAFWVVQYTNYPSIFAAGKKLNPWDQQKDGSCKRGALCKGLVSQETANARTDVHPAGKIGRAHV